jgi:hypothetical protein
MPKKLFTPDEMKELRQNPYVMTVTANVVRFTQEFKELFWNAYQAGKTPFAIFEETGFDPDMLGAKRISSFTYALKTNIEIGKAFSPTARRDCRELPNEHASEIAWLRHELAYLRQEMEFIKKIISTESRSRQK